MEILSCGSMNVWLALPSARIVRQTDHPDRILRTKMVLERTGLSRSTMYRKMQNSRFPKNVQISERCAGWRESAVSA